MRKSEIINRPLTNDSVKLSRCTCRMMAQHVDRSGTPAALLLLVFTIFNLVYANAFIGGKVIDNQNVKSVNILNTERSDTRKHSSNSSDFLVEVLGTGLESNISLCWSPVPNDCNPNNKLNAVWISPSGDRAIYQFVQVPTFKVTTIYFCLRIVTRFGETWSNLGSNFTIALPPQSE